MVRVTPLHVCARTERRRRYSSNTFTTRHWKVSITLRLLYSREGPSALCARGCVNSSSHTNLQISPTSCTILLNICISLLYMFRASVFQSSEKIAVSMRHWYLSLCMCGVWSAGWIFNPTSRPDATHSEWQIPVSHRHSNFSWWWAHGYPKHVGKSNKYTKQNFTPSWIYLQDCTRMRVQQSIKYWNLSQFMLPTYIKHQCLPDTEPLPSRLHRVISSCCV